MAYGAPAAVAIEGHRGGSGLTGSWAWLHYVTGRWWTALNLTFPAGPLLCSCPSPRAALVPPGLLVELAGVSMGSMLAWESGSLLWSQPRSRGTKVLLLRPDQAQYTQLATLAVSRDWRRKRLADNILKGGGCHRFAQEPGGTLWQRAWSISSWASAWGADQGKCYRQNMRSSEFTKKPERQQGGWCCVGAQRNWRKKSASLLLAASWSQGTLDAPTGLLLRARMPKGLCLHGGDKSHQWEHRQTLGEFW